jgi:PQQ-dependent dehydrogenase (methanol/ethanol family)
LRYAIAILTGMVWLAASLVGIVYWAPRADGAPALETDPVEPANVAHLSPIFTFRTGQRGGHAGAPAVMGNLVFLQTPFPHVIYALDISQSGNPVRWSFSPASNRAAAGLDWYDATAGGPVLAEDRLFINTYDGHTICLDAATGHVLWDVAAADPANGEILSSAPIVAAGRVIVGASGDEFGARGWIEALYAGSGTIAWKRFNTGPDRDVGIGPAFNPPYPRQRGADLGARTWPPGAWQQGGGGLAEEPIYDSELTLLLYGTGHPAPWNADTRPGDNLWTSGLFARDARTGDARWFVSLNPHDLYAFGAHGSIVPAAMPWQGRDRALLIHPDANGYVYVLDRRTGTMLSAAPFVAVNATIGIDPATGDSRPNPAKALTTNVTTRDICPGWPGATGSASAFSPRTHLLYIPANRLCMDMEPRDANFIRGTPFIGANIRMTPPGRDKGALIAWDVAAEKPAWTVEENFPVESGVLVTESDVVFYGTLDGWFKAVDGRTGRLLWRFNTSSGIIGQPIEFQLPNQRHCIAVLSGIGGAAGEAADERIDIRDATAAHGYANAMHDLKPPADASGTLYVFALP